jgi:tetratricopeptide (TPR) repeat protein
VQSSRASLSRVATAVAVAAVATVVVLLLRPADRGNRAKILNTPALRHAPRLSRPHHSPSPDQPPPPARESFRAAFDRGVAAYNGDDIEAAVDAFEEAVRLAPDDPEARINLGLVYMRMQRPEDGLRELETGARLEREQGRAPAR